MIAVLAVVHPCILCCLLFFFLESSLKAPSGNLKRNQLSVEEVVELLVLLQVVGSLVSHNLLLVGLLHHRT